MSVSEETLRAARRLRRDLAKVTDRQARELVQAWARGWDEVAGDLDQALQDLAAAAGDGTLTRAQVRRSTRLTRALAVISDQLRTLATDAGVQITGDLRQIVDDAGTAQAALISSQLPAAGGALVVDWASVDAKAIEAIVKRSTQRIHASTRALSREAEAAMKRELIRGLAAGANPRETARRMLRRTENGFNGGLTRALTIARTETLDAHRAGARLSHDANRDVLAGWIWTAELGKRTCPACFAMHGTEHDLEESGPDGHQNCRCARTPKTKTWRELGFDLDEPADVLPDAGEVFADLDQADQLAVLGRGRYDAWARGDLPMSRWATRRSTVGWRDSVVPVKVPA